MENISLGVLLQGVNKCPGIYRLVVGVCTGVNDGDPAACTGVAGCPGGARADHAGGIGLHGLGGLTGQRGVLLLDDDLLDTLDSGDLIASL